MPFDLEMGHGHALKIFVVPPILSIALAARFGQV